MALHAPPDDMPPFDPPLEQLETPTTFAPPPVFSDGASLLFAMPTGLMQLRLDCTALSSSMKSNSSAADGDEELVIGDAVPLSPAKAGITRESRVARLARTGALVLIESDDEVDASQLSETAQGAHVTILDESVEARAQRMCSTLPAAAASSPPWPSCVPGEDGAEKHYHDMHHEFHSEESVRNAANGKSSHGTNEYGGRDPGCIAARHSEAYGMHYAPWEPWTSSPPSPMAASSSSSSSPPAPPPSPPPALKGDREPFGRQGQRKVRLREVDGCLDSPQFLAEHVYVKQPLILRGCAAWSSPRALAWSDAHLNATAPTHVARHPGCKHMPLSKFIGNYQRTDYRFADGGYRICNMLPRSLLRDLTVPPMLRCPDLLTSVENVVMWFSSGRQASRLHFDPNDVLINMLDGTKEVQLIDPIDSLSLYVDYHAGRYGESPIDLRAVDMRKHPRVADATIHMGVVHRGDVLYIPGTWWHLVTSLPRRYEPTARNLAVTMQFEPRPPWAWISPSEHDQGASSFAHDQGSSSFSHDLIHRTLRFRRDGAKRWERMCGDKRSLDSLPTLAFDSVPLRTSLAAAPSDFATLSFPDGTPRPPEELPRTAGDFFRVLFAGYQLDTRADGPEALAAARVGADGGVSTGLGVATGAPVEHAATGALRGVTGPTAAAARKRALEAVISRDRHPCILISHGVAGEGGGQEEKELAWLISVSTQTVASVPAPTDRAPLPTDLGAHECLRGHHWSDVPAGLRVRNGAAFFSYLAELGAWPNQVESEPAYRRLLDDGEAWLWDLGEIERGVAHALRGPLDREQIAETFSKLAYVASWAEGIGRA